MKRIFSKPKSLKNNPFHYCPGCGHSLLHRIIGEVLDEMRLQEIALGVPPAGCAVLAYNYFDIDMGEAPHGRAAAVATGLKRVLPDRLVFTYQGDGDIAAIGTAETIHAANRGENITTIFVNNAVYGMTGGQMAPNSGANIRKTKKAIRRAFEVQLDGMGFSLVEVLSPCPTNWKMSPIDSCKWIDENLVKSYPLGIIKDDTERRNRGS
jgi:2-oxoglutarate ferredoxin oxidoreductase subunit beta